MLTLFLVNVISEHCEFLKSQLTAINAPQVTPQSTKVPVTNAPQVTPQIISASTGNAGLSLFGIITFISVTCCFLLEALSFN